MIQQEALFDKLKYLIAKIELAREMNLNFSQIDALEDSELLMNGFSEYISDLQQSKQVLESQEESNSKKRLLEKHTILLTSAENLHNKLQVLQGNRSFFKENGALFKKITNIFLNVDLNMVNKRATCRNFMFYSLTGTMLFKLGRFLKVASDANWADAIIINQHIGNPYLIMGLSGLAAIYAVKNALKLIGHRNDEAKKQELLATFTKDEWESLVSLVKPA